MYFVQRCTHMHMALRLLELRGRSGHTYSRFLCTPMLADMIAHARGSYSRFRQHFKTIYILSGTLGGITYFYFIYFYFLKAPKHICFHSFLAILTILLKRAKRVKQCLGFPTLYIKWWGKRKSYHFSILKLKHHNEILWCVDVSRAAKASNKLENWYLANLSVPVLIMLFGNGPMPMKIGFGEGRQPCKNILWLMIIAFSHEFIWFLIPRIKHLKVFYSLKG